jgi:hypothetical protein
MFFRRVEVLVFTFDDFYGGLGPGVTSAKPPGSYEAVKGLARPYKVAASLAVCARLAAP